MPKYKIEYETDNLSSSMHWDRPSASEAINSVIDFENEDSDDEIVSIKLELLE